jgi:hypothetical protein
MGIAGDHRSSAHRICVVFAMKGGLVYQNAARGAIPCSPVPPSSPISSTVPERIANLRHYE